VDTILSQLDLAQLIDVHTATLFRTLTQANLNANAHTPRSGSNATNQITDPGPFVDSPHRLAVQAGSPTKSNKNDPALGSGGDGSGTGSGTGSGSEGRSRGNGQGGVYTTLVMPSSVANYGTTVKLVSLPNPPHTSRGLPATTIVVDECTGAVKAVVNARALNIRTALGEWTS